MDRGEKDDSNLDPIEVAFRKFRSRGSSSDDIFLEIEGSHLGSIENLKEYIIDKSTQIAFYERYIIAIVSEFARNEVEQDLILAALKLLDGYRDISKVSKRRDEYCAVVGVHDESDGADKPYNIYWHMLNPALRVTSKKGKIYKANIYRNVTIKENIAIRELSESIRREINKHGGKLGYANDKSKLAEINKITYPKPSYLREEVYRKCTYEGKVFYVPLSEQELVRKAQQHMILEPEEADVEEDTQEDQDEGFPQQDEEQPIASNGDDTDAEKGIDSLITSPEPSPPPLPPPVESSIILKPPPLPKQNRFQIFLEHAKKMFSKYKVSIIVGCIIIAFVAGGIVTYLTSPLWSGNGSNKDNDYDGPGWGDNGGMRPNYTLNEVNAGALGNQIIFNTISDSEMGNEKNFVGARRYTGINAGEDNVWEGNDISVEDGKEYIIRLYVHNNNRDGYDGIAEDTRVSFSIPGESSTHITVYGFIMSSNATPSKYWDYVTFHGPTAFHLEYQSGSALLENNGIGEGGLLLSDAVVDAASGGSPIGFDSLDGRIPGCYTYSSFITIRVKAIFDATYTLETQVRLVGGDKTWDNSVEAEIGDKVEFRMAYKNNDTVDQLNVMINTVLPEGLRYVPGSTKIVNAIYPDSATINQDDITTRGVNIGSYTPGSNAFVRFQAEVVDEGLEYGSNTLVNWGQASVNKTCIQDYATVHLMKD